MSQPYLSLEAKLHDAFWDTEDGGSEIPLMADFLKRYPGTSLEIGAGSGRLMLPLLEQGFQVEGLELSKDMLALAAARAGKAGIGAIFHEGDMANWNSGRTFSALLAPAFTLQLATDPQNTLSHWHRLLEPAGGLYLTVFIPYAELLGDLPENQWYKDHAAMLPDGREGLLETRHRLDPERQIVHREHRYTLSGNPPLKHSSRQAVRWFEHSQMVELLANSGFQVERFFVDFDQGRKVADPDRTDFDGILTYHTARIP